MWRTFSETPRPLVNSPCFTGAHQRLFNDEVDSQATPWRSEPLIFLWIKKIVQNYKLVETPQSLFIFITLQSSTLVMAYLVSNEFQEIFSFLIVYSI